MSKDNRHYKVLIGTNNKTYERCHQMANNLIINSEIPTGGSAFEFWTAFGFFDYEYDSQKIKQAVKLLLSNRRVDLLVQALHFHLSVIENMGRRLSAFDTPQHKICMRNFARNDSIFLPVHSSSGINVADWVRLSGLLFDRSCKVVPWIVGAWSPNIQGIDMARIVDSCGQLYDVVFNDHRKIDISLLTVIRTASLLLQAYEAPEKFSVCRLTWESGNPLYGGRQLEVKGIPIDILKHLSHKVEISEQELVKCIWAGANGSDRKYINSLRTAMSRLRKVTQKNWGWTKAQLPSLSKDGMYKLTLYPDDIDPSSNNKQITN